MNVFKYFSLLFLLSQNGISQTCVQWFKDSKIKPGPDCLLNCTVLNTGMATFDCPNQCPKFCQSPHNETFIFRLSDLYPGLTPAEKALSAKEPKKLLRAYELSWAAIKICKQLYPISDTNDESDACRHFVWAVLLYKEFGIEFATRVLNAHEQNPDQPQNEKSMDLANNRIGLISGEQLSKNNNINENEILESFKDHLSKGNIIVLKPGVKNE